MPLPHDDRHGHEHEPAPPRQPRRASALPRDEAVPSRDLVDSSDPGRSHVVASVPRDLGTAPMSARSRDPRALAKACGAGMVLLALLVGLPLALARAVGWPLPSRWPGWAAMAHALTDPNTSAEDVVIRGTACLLWFTWGLFVAATLLEARAIVEGRVARPLAPAGSLHALARRLLTALTLAAATVPALAAAGAGPAPVVVSHVRPLTEGPGSAGLGVPPVHLAGTEGAPAAVSHVVAARENLWRIAGDELGGGERWGEIWDLNRDRPQPDGRRFTDPDEIRPGWVLDLPSAAVEDTPTPGGTPHVLPAPESAPDLPAFAHTPPPGATTVPEEAVPREEAPGATISLPSGSLVGTSFAAGVASALAMLRLLRRRARRPEAPAPGIRYESHPSERLAERLTALAVAPPEDAVDDEASPAVGAVRPEPLQTAPTRGPFEGLLTAGLLVLEGPGAGGVARALFADGLARHGLRRVEVVVTSALADTLFPGLEPFDGYEVSTDGEAAVCAIEAELLGRARLLEAEGVGDAATYASVQPDDPIPPLLLGLEAGAVEPARLDAVVGSGRRLGLTVVLVGRGDGAHPAVELGALGEVRAVPPTGAAGLSIGLRLPRLEVAEAAQLISVVRAAFVEERPEEPETSPSTFAAPDAVPDPLIEIRLLGPYLISVGGSPVRSGLRTKAKELLAYLALYPEGATFDQAVEALWPEVHPDRGREWFSTARGNLRGVLRKAAGNAELRVVEKVGGRYRLEAGVFDIDLWRFEAALAAARDATDPDTERLALGAAADAYRGELAEGTYFEWVQTPREDLRRRAVDACARLADLHAEREELDAAVRALEAAIAVDPYNEELYRRVMPLEAALGRPSVRRTFQRLNARLAELDVSPEPETVALHRTLVRPGPAAINAGRATVAGHPSPGGTR